LLGDAQFLSHIAAAQAGYYKYESTDPDDREGWRRVSMALRKHVKELKELEEEYKEAARLLDADPTTQSHTRA